MMMRRRMMMMMMMMMMITIIITLKGAIRDFYNFLTAPRTVSNTYANMCKSRATHRALITCNLQCATWYEGTVQLLRFPE